MPEQQTHPQLGEPLEDIIGRQPAWIVRWGITVLFGSILLLLVASWVVKFPEIVSSPIVVTAQSPPVSVVSRSSGKIVTLFVEEGDDVKAGEPLALLETTADWQDISRLAQRLEEYAGFAEEPARFLAARWDLEICLGELQQDYLEFVKAYNLCHSHVQESFNARKIEAARTQLEHLHHLGVQLEEQRSLLSRGATLHQRSFEQSRELFGKKMISENDLAAAEAVFLEKKYSLENAESAIINNQIEIDELRRLIVELEQEEEERRQLLFLDAQNAYRKLVQGLAEWQRRYLLISPASGSVAFYRFWSDNQHVSADEEVMTVVPGLDSIVGRIHLPQQGAGRIEPGQEVHIKFSSFPYRDFGIVKGVVRTISPVAHERTFVITVDLPDGLRTTYNNTLEFSHNMEGQADIITRDLRLIERIFNTFRSLYDQRV